MKTTSSTFLVPYFATSFSGAACSTRRSSSVEKGQCTKPSPRRGRGEGLAPCRDIVGRVLQVPPTMSSRAESDTSSSPVVYKRCLHKAGPTGGASFSADKRGRCTHGQAVTVSPPVQISRSVPPSIASVSLPPVSESAPASP